MDNDIQQLKERVDRLEREIVALKATSPSTTQPWWEKVAGRFENDGAFSEIAKLGREYRQSHTHENQ